MPNLTTRHISLTVLALMIFVSSVSHASVSSEPDTKALNPSSLPAPTFPTATLVTPIAASKASPGCSIGDIYGSDKPLLESLTGSKGNDQEDTLTAEGNRS